MDLNLKEIESLDRGDYKFLAFFAIGLILYVTLFIFLGLGIKHAFAIFGYSF